MDRLPEEWMHRIEARDYEAVRPVFAELDGTHLHEMTNDRRKE
jgi:hypothetical protein